MNNLFSQAAIGWIGRRAMEVGGLITAAVSLYNSLPPQHQETVVAVLTGQGGGLTITAAVGLLLWLWSQFMSYRATVEPQIVTADGTKAKTKDIADPKKKTLVDAIADTTVDQKKAARKPGLLDKLFGRS